MADHRVHPPFVCHSCGSPFSPRLSTCPHCGAIPAVDGAVKRMQSKASLVIRRLWLAVPTTHPIMWVMALTPIVLAPPLTVIWLCLRNNSLVIRDQRTALWLMIVAAANVIISLLILKWIGTAMFEQIDWLRSTIFKAPNSPGLMI